MSDIIQNQWVNYLVIYFLLITKAGFVFYEMYSAISSILLMLILLLIIMSKNLKVSIKQSNVVLIISICIILTGLFKGLPDINKFLLSIINLWTSLLMVTVMTFKRFSKFFSNIIYVICIFSIVGQLLYNMGITLVSYFPLLTNSKGISVYFALIAEFWVVPVDGVYRIQGIFWEPGAFQAMIIIAFLLDIYVNNPQKKKLRYACFVLAILMTYSTTGIISLIMLVILVSVKGKQIKVRNVVSLSVITFALILLIPILYSNLEGFLYYSTFGKLEMLSDAYSFGESNNASSRLESIIFPIKFLIDEAVSKWRSLFFVTCCKT